MTRERVMSMSNGKQDEEAEFTVEPMEDAGNEPNPFGDCSSRHRKQPAESTVASGDSPETEGNSASVNTDESTGAITGKANFYAEDRKIPDRRLGQRRRMVRLTPERRQDQRRIITVGPYGVESRV